MLINILTYAKHISFDFYVYGAAPHLLSNFSWKGKSKSAWSSLDLFKILENIYFNVYWLPFVEDEFAVSF